jgi:hypothetical protein
MELLDCVHSKTVEGLGFEKEAGRQRDRETETAGWREEGGGEREVFG